MERLGTEMSERSHERWAIVIGGSIAGLFVGAFLRRIGWRVDIYERSSIELIGRGVGIFATHLELLEALDKCGAGTVDIGVIVYKRITFDRSGKVIAEKPQLQIVTSWDRLRQVLLKAIDRQRYHFGHMFERVEQDGSEVHVYFANGRSERADLLVGYDLIEQSHILDCERCLVGKCRYQLDLPVSEGPHLGAGQREDAGTPSRNMGTPRIVRKSPSFGRWT